MVTKVRITRGGQTTIPKKLREEFGLEEGAVLTVEGTKEGILFRIPSWIDALSGSGKGTPEDVKRELDCLREEE